MPRFSSLVLRSADCSPTLACRQGEETQVNQHVSHRDMDAYVYIRIFNFQVTSGRNSPSCSWKASSRWKNIGVLETSCGWDFEKAGNQDYNTNMNNSAFYYLM